ncbi:MAG: bifunctional phosphoribosyl-AMP cyclohydrolase/phosphoribosyl-ATP diphosphatase HisIE [Bacteroidales bacterium]|jgi:phosphoribosyl-ATP pyrophosphohydrolase/phosphoribosyl-AMP cyclohydrolase|nr:bifunctional phosphoribosyl-AMP cyclohydrolase/phosphoribosyl-ATP diphosphatase HisIE [Bacteroidales bacterium]
MIKYDTNNLVPAIVQDARTNQVLMMAYMNAGSLEKTRETGLVTFYSRSRKQLWVKGETSGNFLHFFSLAVDCDGDTLLVKAIPEGPCCHTGNYTCWGEDKMEPDPLVFLHHLGRVIKQRRCVSSEASYTSKLFAAGINKIAQKVGEEAIEVVIEAKDDNDNLFLNECADLIFHLMVLLEAKGRTLQDVIAILKSREK